MHSKPERSVTLYRALRIPARRTAMGLLESQTIIGHCIAQSLIQPGILSVFDEVFRLLVQPVPGRMRLTAGMRAEFELFRRLLPHVQAELTTDYYPGVFASDSTLTGWGTTYADARPEDVAEAWVVREKWRHDPRFQPPRNRKEIEMSQMIASRENEKSSALGEEEF